MSEGLEGLERRFEQDADGAAILRNSKWEEQG
jgi:hypothetical protein